MFETYFSFYGHGLISIKQYSLSYREYQGGSPKIEEI